MLRFAFWYGLSMNEKMYSISFQRDLHFCVPGHFETSSLFTSALKRVAKWLLEKAARLRARVPREQGIWQSCEAVSRATEPIVVQSMGLFSYASSLMLLCLQALHSKTHNFLIYFYISFFPLVTAPARATDSGMKPKWVSSFELISLSRCCSAPHFA